ncbi:MAG: hypothetical protein HYU66_12580 [Armatimonadetes bacterium]|nr:hypothetical protein [Armatimonadota bacterium]
MAAGDNPLVRSFEQALAELGAVALAGNTENVVIGHQQLELEVPWSELQAGLQGADPLGWTDRIVELLVARIAAAVVDEPEWATLKFRVMPLLFGRQAGTRFAERCAGALAYPYAEVLLITIAWPVEGGWQFVLQQQLDEWDTSGTAVIGAALDNLRRDTPKEAIQSLEPDHFALDAGDGLDASRLLILDELHDDARACGVLAAAPCREVLSFTPFNRKGYRHLKHLINLAKRCHDSWAFPIIDSLFYIAPHTALHIGVEHDTDGASRLVLPEALAGIHADLIDRGLW